MKRSFKRIMALTIALIMVVGLVACGVDTTASPTPEPDTQTPTTDTPLTATSEESPSTSSLKIGLLLNTTGWFSSFDLQALYETEALAEIINSQGGWDIGGNKYMIELILSDLQSDFNNINAAAMYLIDQGVDYVIESNDFFVSGAQPLWEQNGIMHINRATTMEQSFAGPDNPHAFVAGNNGTVMQLPMSFQLIRDRYPDVNTVVYCENDTGNNQEIYDYLAGFAGQYDLTLLPDYVLYSGSGSEMSAVALQLINSGADAAVIAGTINNFAALIKEVRSYGSDMVLVAPALLSGETIIALAGADAAYNVGTLAYSLAPEDNTEIFNQILSTLREAKGPEVAAQFMGATPNALYVLLNVMSIAESTDVDVVMDTWTAQTEIDTIFGLGFMGGAESYGLPNHAVSIPSSFMTLTKDGIFYGERVETKIP